MFNKSALMLSKHDMVPSMLDPAFEQEDCLSPLSHSFDLGINPVWGTLAERNIT